MPRALLQRFPVLGALALSMAIQAETIFVDGFDSYAASKEKFGDTTRYKLAVDSGRTTAKVGNADSSRSVNFNYAIPDSLRGSVLRISAWSRGQDLSRKPQPWNGVKVMVAFKRSDSTAEYPQLPWPDTAASYPWQKSSMVFSLPENAVRAVLVVGLEMMSGAVWFDSIAVERIGSTRMPPARDPSIPVPGAFGPIRYRGAMIGVPPESAAIADFGAEWKGNLLRWQMNGPRGLANLLSLPDYESHLQTEFQHLDKGLRICRANGIRAVIDMHQMSTGLFLGSSEQRLLIETWKRIARRYGGNPAVAGYDLANEPDESSWRPGALLWNELVDTLCRAIREVDPSTPIVVEPVQGNVDRLSALRPAGSGRGWDLGNIVYSFHFYQPSGLTFQGVDPDAPLGAVYPGTINGETYDSARLHRAMRPAMEYQTRYRVPIYVGEFSCIRWAARRSAVRWLKDVAGILEDQGWDWSYHAYREYHGWSVEYSDSMSDMRDRQNTDRKALLLGLYARNANPYPVSVAPRIRETRALRALRWRRVGAVLVSVDGIPEGSRAEVVLPDGSAMRRIPSSGSFGMPAGVFLCRLTGTVATGWEAVSPVW